MVTAFLLKIFGYWPYVSSRLTGNTLYDATLAVVATWIVSIFLLVLNRDIYRILEGYKKYNPLKIFEKRAKKVYNNKVARLKKLDDEYNKNGLNFPDDLHKERWILMKDLAQKYPDTEDSVLPTAFGNALRAFEVYPRVMYGLEGIDGWPRILAVLPKDYRDLIDDAKAQVDWWVNLSVLSFLLLFEFWILVLCKWRLTLPWFYMVLDIAIPILILIFLNWIFLWRSISAAIGWGNFVKSAFDLYRLNVIDLLGVDSVSSRKSEQKLWKGFSQAIIYRRPDILPRLKKHRTK